MNVHDIIETIVDEYTSETGLSRLKLALKLGKNRAYIRQILSHEPRVSSLAYIANGCGYEVVVRNKTTGREIVVDAPELLPPIMTKDEILAKTFLPD